MILTWLRSIFGKDVWLSAKDIRRKGLEDHITRLEKKLASLQDESKDNDFNPMRFDP